jgi:uncharacterized protein
LAIVRHERVLVDTGPLVALLRRDDASHVSCAETSREISYPLLTSWPVITEAAWLLRNTTDGVSKLLNQIESGLVAPLELDTAAAAWIRAFLEKYRDIGAQLADATICYLSQREETKTVFTLDRRDFSIYRTPDGQAFDLVP